MKATFFTTVATLFLIFTPDVCAELLGFWSFDNEANPLVDESGNGNDLSVGNATDPVWGAATGFGATGAYDYSNDHLIAPIDINPGGLPQMTWGAWVRTDTIVSDLRKVLGHDNGAWDRTMGLDNRAPAGSFRYTTFVGDNPVNNSGPLEGTPGPVNTTDWTFVAASYDQVALTTTMYVDLDASTTGDALVTVTEAAGFGTGFPTFAIGNIRPDNPDSEPWDGSIDNVFIYDEVLTPERVAEIRDGGKLAIVGSSGDPGIRLVSENIPVFGDLTAMGAGIDPVTRTVTVRNIGEINSLSITSISITGPDAEFYSLEPPLPSSVAPESEEDVDITFTPPVEGGNFSASLEIKSNEIETSLVTLSLNASVTSDPNIVVTYDDPLFGDIIFRSTPEPTTRIVTIQNTGVVNQLTVAGPIMATGPNAGDYSFSDLPPIPPGGSAELEVTLDPQGNTGSFVASLDLMSDDPDTPSVPVSLDANLFQFDPPEIMAFYSFDDAADPFNDDSGNGNHLTSVGADPAYEETGGFEGGGMLYSDAGGADARGDQRLIAPLDINPATEPQLTMGAWVRTDTLTSDLYKVMGHDDGAWDRTIGLDNRGGGFRYTAFTGTNNNEPVAGTPGPENTEDWTFLGVTYDEETATVSVFIDLDASTTDDSLVKVSEPTLMGPGLNEVSIGSIRPDNANEGWVGSIDNAFVFRGILTDEEMENLRDQGRAAVLGPDNFRITEVVYNPDNTVTLTWNSNPNPATTYQVLFNPNVNEPLLNWTDDDDSIATQGEQTTYTTSPIDPGETRMYFIVLEN